MYKLLYLGWYIINELEIIYISTQTKEPFTCMSCNRNPNNNCPHPKCRCGYQSHGGSTNNRCILPVYVNVPSGCSHTFAMGATGATGATGPPPENVGDFGETGATGATGAPGLPGGVAIIPYAGVLVNLVSASSLDGLGSAIGFGVSPVNGLTIKSLSVTFIPSLLNVTFVSPRPGTLNNLSVAAYTTAPVSIGNTTNLVFSIYVSPQSTNAYSLIGSFLQLPLVGNINTGDLFYGSVDIGANVNDGDKILLVAQLTSTDSPPVTWSGTINAGLEIGNVSP